MTTIQDRNGTSYIFRILAKTDTELLTDYFLGLSAETRSKYAPHPFTSEHAEKLCNLADDTADRYIVLTQEPDAIIGYFIVEYGDGLDEAKRYREQGIDLVSSLDPLFAPSMADAYQNRGLASLVMPLIVGAVKDRGARSLVLMGGTRETNSRAIAFYEKSGFKRHSGFQTSIYNHDMRLVF